MKEDKNCSSNVGTRLTEDEECSSNVGVRVTGVREQQFAGRSKLRQEEEEFEAKTTSKGVRRLQTEVGVRVQEDEQ